MGARESIARLHEATTKVRAALKFQPRVGLVLGSGLSDVLDRLENATRFAFSEIPHFPVSTVVGHAGEVLAGTLAGKLVWAQRGRVHHYEGRPMSEVAFPIRLMKLLGVQTVILTNAAGGVNPQFRVGVFVLINDHINTLPDNPLRGENVEELGPRFPNLLDAYSAALRALAQRAAQGAGLGRLHEGVYLVTQGPMYETPAEIRAFAKWGADLVGMSTVPEAIAARHMGMDVLGISVVTNLAAGLDAKTQLSHQEVLDTTQRRRGDFAKLLLAILAALP